MQRINLLDVLPKPIQPPLPAALMGQILGGFIGFLFLVSIVLYWHASNLADTLKQATTEQAQLTNQLNKIKLEYPSVAENQRLKSDIQTLKTRLLYQQKIMEILKEQFITKPFSVYFEIFARQTPMGIWLTRMIINNPKNFLTIIGQTEKTDLIPMFVKQLDKEPILDGTQFRTFKIISSTESKASTPTKKDASQNNNPENIIETLDSRKKYPEFILSTLSPNDALEELNHANTPH